MKIEGQRFWPGVLLGVVLFVWGVTMLPSEIKLPESAETMSPSTGSVFLEVKPVLQLPELPNGCEVTALAEMMGYCKVEADKCELADNYLPAESLTQAEGRLLGPDPEKSYVGNPRDELAYYCFPPVLVECADNYLAEGGASLRGSDLSGAEEAALIAELEAGNPIAVWATIGLEPPEKNPDRAWTVKGTETPYIPWKNLHCMVLCGYDTERFYFADPRGETTFAARADFMTVYRAVGKRAMVLRAAPAE